MSARPILAKRLARGLEDHPLWIHSKHAAQEAQKGKKRAWTPLIVELDDGTTVIEERAPNTRTHVARHPGDSPHAR